MTAAAEANYPFLFSPSQWEASAVSITIPGDCHDRVAARTGHLFLRPSWYAWRTEAGDLFNSKRVA